MIQIFRRNLSVVEICDRAWNLDYISEFKKISSQNFIHIFYLQPITLIYILLYINGASAGFIYSYYSHLIFYCL